MNTALPALPSALRPLRAVVGALIAWRDAIASLPLAAWKRAGLIALAITILNCALIVGSRRPSVDISAVLPICFASAIGSFAQVMLAFCGWAIADRPGVAPDRRVRRLVIALSAAVALQAVLVPALKGLLLGHLDLCVVDDCEGMDFSKVPWWLMNADDSGQMFIFFGLGFAWLEMNRRGREVEQRLLATQQERARLLRSAFDARLTAMRAQVDPQFLFDSLADVQGAYAVDTGRGAATLDCLITYLRTALPRLRTEGSTVGAEADLVGAWLAVVRARRQGLPAWRVDVEADCSGVPFPATVLLPLVQWALGNLDQPPRVVSLNVRRLPGSEGGQLHATLRLEPERRCSDEEPAPRRVRERLRALYGEAAGLTCGQDPGQPGSRPASTVITLHWPDESA
jgi:histidine kinase